MFDKVSVVIPCYWHDKSLFDMTINCLETLYSTAKPYEVIVVDDGSPYRGEITHTTVIELPENGGFAKAVNAGLAICQGDVLVVCNNDIEFIQDGWLDHLIKPLEQGYDIASIRTTDVDGWDVMNMITENDKFGSLWAMTREVYKKIGGLDESFGRGYFEDLDYKKRAESAGFRVAKNHAGLVEHIGKGTFGVIDRKNSTSLRAKEIFKRKWGYVE